MERGIRISIFARNNLKKESSITNGARFVNSTFEGTLRKIRRKRGGVNRGRKSRVRVAIWWMDKWTRKEEREKEEDREWNSGRTGVKTKEGQTERNTTETPFGNSTFENSESHLKFASRLRHLSHFPYPPISSSLCSFPSLLSYPFHFSFFLLFLRTLQDQAYTRSRLEEASVRSLNPLLFDAPERYARNFRFNYPNLFSFFFFFPLLFSSSFFFFLSFYFFDESTRFTSRSTCLLSRWCEVCQMCVQVEKEYV